MGNRKTAFPEFSELVTSLSIPWERPDSGSLVCSDAACTTAAIFPTEAKAGEEYTVYWNFGLDGFRLYNLSQVDSMTYGDDWGSPLYPMYITIGPSGSQNPFSNPVYSDCCATYQKLVNDVWTPVDENLYYTTVENGGNRTNKRSLRLYGVADSGTYRMSDFYMSITDQNRAEILRLYPALPTAEVAATINPKQLTITGVQAVDRSYDGTNTVQLTGGTLQDLEKGDDVSFTLGEGTMINADQGTGKSVSTDIQLTGEKSGNYTLTQPTDLTVDISAGIQAAPNGITAADETISGKDGLRCL